MWLLIVRDIGSTLLLFSLHILLLWAVTRENLRLYPPWVVSFITAAKWKSSSISLYVCTTMSYDALRCQCGCFRPQIDNLSPPWPSVCFSSLYYYLLSEGIRVVKRYLDCQVHSSGDSGLTSNLLSPVLVCTCTSSWWQLLRSSCHGSLSHEYYNCHALT